MTLLDDDSRAVLGLLRKAGSEPQQHLQRSAGRARAAGTSRVRHHQPPAQGDQCFCMLCCCAACMSCHDQPHLPLKCCLQDIELLRP